MIVIYTVLAWLGIVGIGSSFEPPSCVDRVNQVLASDGLIGSKATVENYPFGVSLLFQKGDYKYDYFFTDDETMFTEALDNGYISLGKCLLNKTPVYFTHGSKNITEGA